MLFAGVAFMFSRQGVTFRDPDARSCRVYGLYNGMVYASTYGSGTPRGLTFGRSLSPRSPWAWLWPDGGLVEYYPLKDPNAAYTSDWRVQFPLWLLFAAGAAAVTPYFHARMPRYQRLLQRRAAIANRERAQAFLVRGVCASCGYSIGALPESDGRRRCPECGDWSARRRA